MTDCLSSQEEFRLQISGPGLDVDRMVNSETIAAVLSAAMAPRPSGARETNVSSISDSDSSLSTTTSLREFLDGVGATAKSDQIVAIGSFLSKVERQAEFSRNDIRSRFSSAREPMPSNFSRDFSKTLRKAFIAEVHKKPGFYYVTKTGMQAVQNHFSNTRNKS